MSDSDVSDPSRCILYTRVNAALQFEIKHTSPAKPRWACCDVTRKSIYYHNCVFGTSENLYIIVKQALNLSELWYRVSVYSIIRPLFFEGKETGDKYLDVLTLL